MKVTFEPVIPINDVELKNLSADDKIKRDVKTL